MVKGNAQKEIYMNNNITVFESNQFGRVRTAINNGEVWFVAQDICKALDLTNTTMVIGRLDDDEVTKFNLGSQSGESNIISKSGLYSLVLASRKPEAKQFKRWITHEVIPSIEKHGMYATAETAEKILSDPDFLIATLTALKAEREAKEIAHQQIQADAPKVAFANSLAVSDSTILVGDLAKILKQNGFDIGANRLFSWMRGNGYLINRNCSDYNNPTQKSMDLGLFKIKETVISHADGHTTISCTPKLTAKGQVYFINKFLMMKEVSI